MRKSQTRLHIPDEEGKEDNSYQIDDENEEEDEKWKNEKLLDE